MRGGFFFNFATDFRSRHDSISTDFTAGKSVLEDFRKYAYDNGFTYISRLGQIMDDAQEVAADSNYEPAVEKDIAVISKKIEADEHGLFEKNSKEISELLAAEIMGRFYGDTAQVKATLRYDKQAKVAEAILNNAPLYMRILGLAH